MCYTLSYSKNSWLIQYNNGKNHNSVVDLDGISVNPPSYAKFLASVKNFRLV